MPNHDLIDQELVTLRVPSHSDFIVHWTGHDIAKTHGIKRINEISYAQSVVNDYLERLLNILRYGLWLTKKKGDSYIHLKSGDIKKPNVARACFTELKLSDSYLHARNFGALGIGVKRYFLFNRFGAPMHYVHDTPSLFLPPYSNFFNPDSPDYELMSFFKNMSSGRNIQKYIGYDLYEESEWRIIFSENIKGRIPTSKVQKYFIDPRDPAMGLFHDFYNSLPADNRPEYLTPLDEWTALIVYPNLQIKNAAYENREIRSELKKLKSADKALKPGLTVAEGCPVNEIANQVMEIDIGAINNL